MVDDSRELFHSQRAFIVRSKIIANRALPVDKEQMGEMDLRIGWSDLQIRCDHLTAVENDRPRDAMLRRKRRGVGHGIRESHNRNDADLIAILFRDGNERIREVTAGGAGGHHDIDQQNLAAIILRVVLRESGIRQRESRRAAIRVFVCGRREQRGGEKKGNGSHLVFPARARSDSSYGARATPFSVMIAVTYRLGVTSNAGLRTSVPFGATGTPKTCVTSPAARSSIGIRSPVESVRSSVE